MLLKVTVLLCIVFATQGLARRDLHHQGRDLKQTQLTLQCILLRANTTSAVVSATAKAFNGTVSAHISATSSAVSVFTNAVVEIFSEAIANATTLGQDVIAVANSAGSATGNATAQAYVSAIGQLTSNGTNNAACIEGFASADATATAFARAFIDVLAQASNGVSFASADGAAEALSIATASAFASVNVSACGSGEFNITLEAEILARATAKPFAEVFGVALAIVSGDSAFGQILVEAASNTVEVSTIDASGILDIVGNGTGQITATFGTCTTQQDICPFIRFVSCCLDGRKACNCGIGCSAIRADFGENPRVAYMMTESSVTTPPFPPQVGHVCFC